MMWIVGIKPQHFIIHFCSLGKASKTTSDDRSSIRDASAEGVMDAAEEFLEW